MSPSTGLITMLRKVRASNGNVLIVRIREHRCNREKGTD